MSAESTKTFPAFQLTLFANANSFVRCWSNLYNFPNYHLYKSIITKPILENGDLQVLFKWKNGMNLSRQKEKTFVDRILKQESLVFELKNNFDNEKFLKAFGDISAIWQIFLLHILQPFEIPIFDQHVYRAFRFIQYQDDKTLPLSKTGKLNVYYKEYYPFFLDMKDLAEKFDHFEIDKAMWTFGKLIKQYPGFVKIEPRFV